MPRMPQQSALNPPLPPIGFETFTNAQSIRRHSI
jgi:hypothetical protein